MHMFGVITPVVGLLKKIIPSLSGKNGPERTSGKFEPESSG